MHPVIIFLLLVGSLLFISWCKRQPPEIRTKAIIYVAITAILLLVLTGRMHWLMGVIGAGIAILTAPESGRRTRRRIRRVAGDVRESASDRWEELADDVKGRVDDAIKGARQRFTS